MIRLHYVLLIVGYLLQLITILTLITFPYIVHSTIAYLTRHIITSPLLTHSVSLTDLVCCVDTVNKVSVLYIYSYCSNVYISLTIVIVIAGAVLVFLMFILNLTVIDGTINAFIFYANIISMNSPILFPKLDGFTPT